MGRREVLGGSAAASQAASPLVFRREAVTEQPQKENEPLLSFHFEGKFSYSSQSFSLLLIYVLKWFGNANSL